MTPFELFWYWVNERHAIYLRRQAGEPWPWTNDPILQEYKFTNVFRELDRGTVWYRENIREPYADHPRLFSNTCFYRQFNRWQTAEHIGYLIDPEQELARGYTTWERASRKGHGQIWWPEHVEGRLRELAATGQPLFTGAHMMTGIIGAKMGHDKTWQTVYVVDQIWQNEHLYAPQPGDTLQSAFNRLVKATGFGAFLAYEVISDLRWTRYLNEASDIMTWANPGPGAVRGINRTNGWELGKRAVSNDRYVQEMRYLLDVSPSYLEDYVPALEMRDIEHSLCEFDKYSRVFHGQGKPRSKYHRP